MAGRFGLYGCREIGPYGKFSCFFVVKGLFRRRVELVAPETAARMARRLGPRSADSQPTRAGSAVSV
ncbi:hypothetical protein P3T27_000269 [Kitasatospora sp. MAA19]|nr:hypothetical protein [Kitasatospora sp. MAA19]